MKTSIRNLMLAGVAGLALVSATVAIAGGPGCDGFGPGRAGHGPAAMDHGPWAGGHGRMGHAAWGVGHGRGGFDHGNMVGEQLDALKQSLALTPQQEPAWTAFAEAAKRQATRMGELRDEVGSTARTLPERVDQRAKFAKERERAFSEVGATAKALYEVLTPVQRTKIDRRGPWMF